MRRNAIVAAIAASILGGAIARARPLDSVDAARAAAAAELGDLDRRAGQLDEQLTQREHLLRRRLRALYKLSQCGAFRLLTEVRGPDELERRIDAARRLVSRDLGELDAMDDERAELERDRARRSDALVEERALREAHDLALRETSTGLQRRRGQLPRPVPGVVTVGIGHVHVREPRAGLPALELPRRAVELSASAGETVRSVAAGTVYWVGELEGQGQVVIVDHGDRYVSETGRLGRVAVTPGMHVREGAVLGAALGDTISFELSEGHMALDPLRWLRPPPAPAGTATTIPNAAPQARAATLMR